MTYAEANASYKIAFAKYSKAVAAYRARTIGDSEYIAARKEFSEVESEWEKAFAKAAGHEAS